MLATKLIKLFQNITLDLTRFGDFLFSIQHARKQRNPSGRGHMLMHVQHKTGKRNELLKYDCALKTDDRQERKPN